MADLPELFCRNAASFGALVDRIPPDGWTRATPCAEWDVRSLVNHVTNEQLWAPHLIAGETIADVGDRYDGDVLGDDPPASFHRAVSGSTAAFTGPGALDGITHLSYADVPAAEYATQMITDLAVHGWDLAKAIGADADMDDETVALLLPTWIAQEDLVRGSGMFGQQVDLPDTADDQSKLLALLGRNPS